MSDGESSPPAQLSNEDLMRRLRAGDKDALEQLCEKNTGLIRKIAWGICWSYNIDQVDEQGFTTEYTRQMRMELTSVGMTALNRLQKNYSDSKLELWDEINDYLKYTDRIKP